MATFGLPRWSLMASFFALRFFPQCLFLTTLPSKMHTFVCSGPPKITPKPKIDQTWSQWEPNLEPAWPKMVQNDNFPAFLVYPPHILRSRTPFWTYPPRILRPGVQNAQRVYQKSSSETQNDRRVYQNWSSGAQKLSHQPSQPTNQSTNQQQNKKVDIHISQQNLFCFCLGNHFSSGMVISSSLTASTW